MSVRVVNARTTMHRRIIKRDDASHAYRVRYACDAFASIVQTSTEDTIMRTLQKIVQDNDSRIVHRIETAHGDGSYQVTIVRHDRCFNGHSTINMTRARALARRAMRRFDDI